jgi:hypothetical protein
VSALEWFRAWLGPAARDLVLKIAPQFAARIEALIVRLKGREAAWGARKIRELLARRLAGEVRAPSNFSDLV